LIYALDGVPKQEIFVIYIINKINVIAIFLLATVTLSPSPAYAKTVVLSGDAADKFIERHFPNADIPGPVKGAFKYVNRYGKIARGYAKCFVPAMGGQSNGEVSSCNVRY
jgi:hypothetical protein